MPSADEVFPASGDEPGARPGTWRVRAVPAKLPDMNSEGELGSERGPPLRGKLRSLKVLPDGSADLKSESGRGSGQQRIDAEGGVKAGTSTPLGIGSRNWQREQVGVAPLDVAPVRTAQAS